DAQPIALALARPTVLDCLRLERQRVPPLQSVSASIFARCRSSKFNECLIISSSFTERLWTIFIGLARRGAARSYGRPFGPFSCDRAPRQGALTATTRTPRSARRGA